MQLDAQDYSDPNLPFPNTPNHEFRLGYPPPLFAACFEPGAIVSLEAEETPRSASPQRRLNTESPRIVVRSSCCPPEDR
jgi:hypothetical protein